MGSGRRRGAPPKKTMTDAERDSLKWERRQKTIAKFAKERETDVESL